MILQRIKQIIGLGVLDQGDFLLFTLLWEKMVERMVTLKKVKN